MTTRKVRSWAPDLEPMTRSALDFLATNKGIARYGDERRPGGKATVARLLIGVGMGGFVDGILLHQI